MAFLIQSDQNNINTHVRSMISLSDGKYVIVFDANPRITESNSITYNSKSIPQLPTSINYFDNVSARVFSISDIKFISRTRQEASNNNQVIYHLRYLTKPNFGKQGNGLPPKIVTLNGFNPYTRIKDNGNIPVPGPLGAINSIPVVITSFDIDWPNDTDFIPDNDDTATPIIRTGSLTLLEVHSPKQISEFDLNSFFNGDLLGW